MGELRLGDLQSNALYRLSRWDSGSDRAALFALELLLALSLVCHLLSVATRCEPRKAGAPLWLELAALIPLYAFISVFWAYDTTGALVAYSIWIER